MALLDIFKSSAKKAASSQQTQFQKLVLWSEDVDKDLEKIALSYNISIKELDFRILSYKTLYKQGNVPKYQEVSPIEEKKFFSLETLTNPNIDIKQKINIEVFKKEKKKLPLKMGIGGNKSLTKIILKVPPQNNINFTDSLFNDLMEHIDKRKAKLGILLGFGNDTYKNELKALVSDIQINAKVSKNYLITLCQGLEVVHQNNGELILHFEKNSSDTQEEKNIDHSNRDFMQTVQKGDLVIEVHKSREGQIGRNCKGCVINFTQIELSHNLDVVVSEDFIVKEEGEKIFYYAAKDGFIYESSPQHYEIKDELVVDEISFKATGSIDAGEQNNIKVNIEGKDSLVDTIGQGMKIESAEVKTNGNVGSGAEVKADKVEIGGQTHQSSKIIAKDVTIHLHKGYVSGDIVHIDILENGTVEANIAYIDKASGGKVIAKEIYFNEVLSNMNAFASQYIEIDTLRGDGNKFIIDPKSQRDFKEQVEKLEDSIQTMQQEIKLTTKKIKLLRRKIQNEQENVHQIHQTVKELKERNTNVPLSLMNKLRENQKNIKEHNLLLKELKDDKIALETFENDLKEMINSVFSARVVNKSIWKEFNEVKFKVVEPPIEVSHLFSDGEMISEITLKTMEDGNYTLERKKG